MTCQPRHVVARAAYTKLGTTIIDLILEGLAEIARVGPQVGVAVGLGAIRNIALIGSTILISIVPAEFAVVGKTVAVAVVLLQLTLIWNAIFIAIVTPPTSDVARIRTAVSVAILFTLVG